jgi:hypothetical protein
MARVCEMAKLAYSEPIVVARHLPQLTAIYCLNDIKIILKVPQRASFSIYRFPDCLPAALFQETNISQEQRLGEFPWLMDAHRMCPYLSSACLLSRYTHLETSREQCGSSRHV